MSNDERQNGRVDAALKVRYKTATIGDFIEKHSHDISSGGVFIRAKKPMSKGTLMKIDFRLEDEKPVIIGVGRVVWTRKDTGDPEKPPGMGIKFIKLDDVSRENIDKIIQFKKEGKTITKDSVSPPKVQGIENQQPDIMIGALKSSDEGEPKVSDDTKSLNDKNIDNQPKEPDNSTDSSNNDGDNHEDNHDEDDNEVTSKIDVSSHKSKDAVKVETSAPVEAMTDLSDSSTKKSGGPLLGIVVVIVLLGVAFYFYQVSGTSSSNNLIAAIDTESDTHVSNTPVNTNENDTANKNDTANENDTANTDSAADTEIAVELSGAVKITSQPGSTIFINGEDKGVSPLSLDGIAAGKPVKIEAKLFGFITETSEITPEKNKPLVITMPLKKAKVIVVFNSNVAGGVVKIDKKWAGRIGNKPLTVVRRVDNSEAAYTVTKPGYAEVTGSIASKDWVYNEGVYTATVLINMVTTKKPAVKPVAKPVAKPAAEVEDNPYN